MQGLREASFSCWAGPGLIFLSEELWSERVSAASTQEVLLFFITEGAV